MNTAAIVSGTLRPPLIALSQSVLKESRNRQKPVSPVIVTLFYGARSDRPHPASAAQALIAHDSDLRVGGVREHQRLLRAHDDHVPGAFRQDRVPVVLGDALA